MGKQKVVIRLGMTDARKVSKALKIVVGFNGVTSASLDSKKKDQIVVGGDGIDPVSLVKRLRKYMKCVELLKVESEDEKEEKDKSKDLIKAMELLGWPHHFGIGHPYTYCLDYDPWCCIM
ncbi:heavy metal-associated isoprenylated plant protein 39-like [Phoenix dactylifera]|uniref:Heavy metal-associated isoprenylated plant protein 39-like n=1 Tax=Phoenix dactylifera TaxID=42345 RepID=A0A8B8J6J1_PHODC|nr:heavy metal-associated isoprenylated plant protein 39-like [Phoenix dactylifera]